jgi:hypothetical protein
LQFNGYAKYLIVDAVNTNGHIIGNAAISTLADGNISPEAVAEEEQWLLDLDIEREEAMKRSGKLATAFGAGMICGVLVLLLLRYARHGGAGSWNIPFAGGQKYQKLPQ